jgi:hypothetical protein
MRVSTRRLIKALGTELDWRDQRVAANALLHFRRKLARARSLHGGVEYERIMADLDDAIKELSR